MMCISAMPRIQVTPNEIKDVTIGPTDQLKTVMFVFEPFKVSKKWQEFPCSVLRICIMTNGLFLLSEKDLKL